MKIAEIVTERSDKDTNKPKPATTVDQAAQLYAQHGQTLPSEVIMVAKRIHANSELDANDAISMAKELDDKSGKKKSTYVKPASNRTPMGDRTPADTDRVSKTGKKWGNQYYYDPNKPEKSPSQPKSQKYKDIKQKIKNKVGKITRQDDIDLGLDIAKDITTGLDDLMQFGKTKKTK